MSHFITFMKRWLYGVLFGLDITLCAAFGGAPLESFSARFYQNRNAWGAAPRRWTDAVARVLGQPNHCEGAWNAYQARVRAAPVWSG